jgi:NifB/MoaA-like Fe-S oxidoreductase
MITNTPRLEDMDLQELDALHAELYVVLLSFQSMGITRMKHKFLREHLQETMTEMQNLLKETDRILDLIPRS